MKRNFVKAASTSNMLKAFQNKIDELTANTATEPIEAASTADMLDAFEDRIDELEDIDSTTDVECTDDLNIADEGIDDIDPQPVEGSDWGEDKVFMLMDYVPDSGENGMEGDDFYLVGKFFAENEEDAEDQLHAAFTDEGERMSQLSNPYVTEYNPYFDDGEEVCTNLATLVQNSVLTPGQSSGIYDVDENGMPVFSATEDNMYDAAYSFEADEAKMDAIFDELWSLKNDNPEVAKAIEDFDARYHGEYEPLRFVLEVGYGLSPEDYTGVPPFTVYIKDKSIAPDSSNDMLNDLAVPDSLEIFDTDVNSCDTINAASTDDDEEEYIGDNDIEDDYSDGEFEDDEEYDPEFDSTADDWELIDKKSIRDSDGFLTDYILYRNTITDLYVCVYGDSDVYKPEDGYFDFETENYDEAIEWFNSYDPEND